LSKAAPGKACSGDAPPLLKKQDKESKKTREYTKLKKEELKSEKVLEKMNGKNNPKSDKIFLFRRFFGEKDRTFKGENCMSRVGPRNREDQAQNVERSEGFPHSAEPELLSPAESGIATLLQKSILDGVEEGREKVEDVGKCSFEVSSEFFDGIEVRRVRRQVN
jgi:hypothetical protein